MVHKVRKILDDLSIKYNWQKHEPIKTYEDAIRIDKLLGFTGTETKNLFLKDDQNNFYVFLTTSDIRFDRKIMKEKINKKLSIATPDELINITKFVPGSAASYPYDENIVYLIDNRIFNTNKLICSGGVPTESYEMDTNDLKKILDFINNKKIYLDL